MKTLCLSTALLVATASSANALMQPVTIDGNGNFTVPAIQAGVLTMPSFTATYTTETLQNGTLDTNNNVLTFGANAIKTTVYASINQQQQTLVFTHDLNLSSSNGSATINSCAPTFNIFCAAIASSSLSQITLNTINPTMLNDFFNFQQISASGIHQIGQFDAPYEANMKLSPVPTPAALWLFSSAIAGLIIRKK